MPKEEQSKLFNRYIWLLDQIYSAGHITYEEINRRWVSSKYNPDGYVLPKKTFRRHCQEIEDLFGIEIVCDRKDKYQYSIKNFADIEEGGIRTWLLNTFSVNNLINESYDLKRRILFEDIPSGQRFLTPIIQAMRDGLKVSLTYQSYHKEEPSIFEVDPYCVKVFRQRWYLLAKPDYTNPDKDDNGLRVYALDRIRDIDTLDRKFELPARFDLKGDFRNIYGVTLDSEYDVTRITLKVNALQSKYLRDLHIHPSQKEIETEKDYSVFEFYLVPNDEFVMELLSYGPDVEVLSPEWLRGAMKDRAMKVLKLYSTDKAKPAPKDNKGQ
jgi:hypothetical protein